MCVFIHPYAAETAQFGTVRAQTSIPQLFHANKAAENFRYTLKRHARDKNGFQINMGVFDVCIFETTLVKLVNTTSFDMI